MKKEYTKELLLSYVNKKCSQYVIGDIINILPHNTCVEFTILDVNGNNISSKVDGTNIGSTTFIYYKKLDKFIIKKRNLHIYKLL